MGLPQKTTPRISVCLPTFNRARYLEQTIASIRSQTVTDFELIVSDNCSTDSTPQVAAAARDPRIRYVRNESNVGHYRNMNRCLELARGEYVCIIHDDDVYAPAFLERESAVLERHHNVGMVHCAVYVVDPERNRIRIQRAYPDTRILDGRQEFVRYLRGHNVCCSTVMARRTLFQAVGPFEPELMCADWLMWMNFALRSDVAYVADPLVEMRVHEATMTSSMQPAQWHQEIFEILDRAVRVVVAQEDRVALLLEAQDLLLQLVAGRDGQRGGLSPAAVRP